MMDNVRKNNDCSVIVNYLSVCLSDTTSERCVGGKVVDAIYFGESYVTNFIKI
jgi:hypothetical protein